MHWILTSTDGKQVLVWDSLRSKHSTTLSKTLQMKLWSMLVAVEVKFVSLTQTSGNFEAFSTTTTTGSHLQVKIMDSQQQHNYKDCGLHAMANLLDLVLGIDPCSRNHEVDKLRPHLLKMLTTKVVEAFPATPLTHDNWRKDHKLTTIAKPKEIRNTHWADVADAANVAKAKTQNLIQTKEDDDRRLNADLDLGVALSLDHHLNHSGSAATQTPAALVIDEADPLRNELESRKERTQFG
jgi:hypothetical protein